MNYYQYKRREPRSRATDFIKPFLVIIIFIGIILSAWKLLAPALRGTEQNLSSEKVYLDIATGGAKAMTSGNSDWKTVPTNIYLYEAEKIMTQSDGRVILNFFDKDTIRLDKSTQLDLTSLHRETTAKNATLNLVEGRLWVNIDSTSASPSEFVVKTGLLTLKSKGGSFAVGYPGMVYVINGSVNADVELAGKIVKSTTLGVGQEMVVDEQIATDLSEGLSKEVIYALDDAFKTSNWYRWNQQQEDASGSDVTDGTTDTTDTSDTTDVTDLKDAETGAVTDETDKSTTDKTDTETTKTDVEEAVADTSSKPLEVPKITVPGSNGDTVTLDSTEQVISGTVSSGTEKVIVNDYSLSKYVPGSGKFSYSAKVAYSNLKVGENEFKVIAVDKDGTKTKAVSITLILPQAVYDKAKTEEAEKVPTTDAPVAAATGGVTITGPNGGENLVSKETSFVITGGVPSNTVKVKVNGYQLMAYKAGDSIYSYKANSSLGNLEIGALNTYTVKAYDLDDKLIGSASMTINVEASATGAGNPVITMPSASASYTTTLDQIVVGGTVGKWVEVVYLNGTKINEYIPGSEQWKKTVTLTPGENKFSVYGEKGGEKTGTAGITVQYQN